MTMPHAEASIFGRIVTGADVEHAASALLKRWSSTYIAEVERQHDIEAGTLPRIRSWSTVNQFENWPADQLPASLLLSTGTVPPPQKNGRGVYRACFTLGIAVVCATNNAARSNELAKLYIAAHRTLLIQRPSLEADARGVDWIGDDYSDLGVEDSRFLSAGMAEFIVEFDDVVSTGAGPVTPDEPLDPDTDPWADWPRVQTTEIDVDAYPPSEPLPQLDD
jgi:hypothetical protein